MFDNASREYEYIRYRIDVDIKKIDNMTCKACGDDPLACHCDGNMKIFRLKSANEYNNLILFYSICFKYDCIILCKLTATVQNLCTKASL